MRIFAESWAAGGGESVDQWRRSMREWAEQVLATY